MFVGVFVVELAQLAHIPASVDEAISRNEEL